MKELRPRHGLLLVLLAAFLGLTSCAGPTEGPVLAMVDTFSGSPLEFEGDGVLVVAVWARWAPVWKLLGPEVEGFQQAAPPGVSFQYVNADGDRDLVRSLGVSIVPSLVVVRKRKVLSVLPNVTTSDQLKAEVAKWLGA